MSRALAQDSRLKEADQFSNDLPFGCDERPKGFDDIECVATAMKELIISSDGSVALGIQLGISASAYSKECRGILPIIGPLEVYDATQDSSVSLVRLSAVPASAACSPTRDVSANVLDH